MEIGSERPFVMKPLMRIKDSYAVIRTLPIGDFDDLESPHRYTAHFTTYFTIDESTFDNVMQPAYATQSLVIYSIADYELHKWVKAGKVFWIDEDDPKLSLHSGQDTDFPYGNFLGNEGACTIFKGRLHSQESHQSGNPCKRNSESNLLSKAWNIFLKE